jgi:glutaminyl-peptide cyclotransferase
LELQAKTVSSRQIMSDPFVHYHRIFLQLLLVISLAFGGISSAAPVYSYKVIARYPHSSDSYTEGFFYLNGMFYEGTGRTGRSAVLVIEPKTGRIVQRRDLAPEYFGEGIVDWGRIFMSGRGHRTFVSSTTA